MKAKVNNGKAKREAQVSQGAYDGRFRPRVVADKKKKAKKNWARKNK